MREVLQMLVNGEISINDAEEKLKITQIQQMGENIKFDNKREDRVGVAEAVYAQGKTDTDLINLLNNIKIKNNLLVTRLPPVRFNRIKSQISKKVLDKSEYSHQASMLVIKNTPVTRHKGKVGIITAGTADIPVAEEANITIKMSGFETVPIYDVGVAGIHRLINKTAELLDESIDIIIAVAGMEGALPSVIAGLVDVPLIAVPTSTGYGVGQKGFTALFAMLQSCAPAISTMNIDNGYGAGIFAITTLKHIEKRAKNGY